MNLSLPEFNVVLTKGSLNVKPEHHTTISRADYSNCNVLEGKFTISNRIWKVIFVNNRFERNIYPHYFKNRLAKLINNICNIAFYRAKVLKHRYVILAYCINNYKRCKNFKIVIDKNTFTGRRNVEVFSTSINFCHPYKITDRVSGVSRDVAINVLQKNKPFTYRRAAIKDASRLIVASGNLQSIKSEPTIRKIRSQALNRLKRDKDDNMDVILMKRDHSEYIQQVSLPFNIKVFSKEQLHIMKYSQDGTLYFDATGTVMKNQKGCASILYYCGIVITKDHHRLCPIMEMISSEHDRHAIYDLFVRFTKFCDKHHAKSAFKYFVTDFSLANIHAASLALNNVQFDEYLKICFDIAINLIVLKLLYCVAHTLLKMFVDTLTMQCTQIKVCCNFSKKL